MIYLVCFFFSVLFAYFARRTNKKSLFVFFSVISIMITVTLAGCRGLSVGIDTSSYYSLTRFWRGAVRSASFGSYMDLFFRTGRGTQEVFFGVLTGVIARLTKNYNVFLGVCHLIIVGCVYIGAFRMKEHSDPEFTLLLFYLLYYNHSLNVFRQYVAMAIIFAVAADIEKKKYLRYLIFVTIAFLFHNTAIIGLAPLFLHMTLFPSNPLKRVPVQRKVFTLIVIVGGTVSFVPLVEALIRAGVVSSKYLYYLNSEDSSAYTLVLLFLLVEIIGLVFTVGVMRNNDDKTEFFLYCSIAFIALYVLATTVKYGKRIAGYFSFLNIVTLGLMNKYQKNSFNRMFVKTAVVVAVFAYWLYVYPYRNASHTLPYVLGV